MNFEQNAEPEPLARSIGGDLDRGLPVMIAARLERHAWQRSEIRRGLFRLVTIGAAYVTISILVGSYLLRMVRRAVDANDGMGPSAYSDDVNDLNYGTMDLLSWIAVSYYVIATMVAVGYTVYLLAVFGNRKWANCIVDRFPWIGIARMRSRTAQWTEQFSLAVRNGCDYATAMRATSDLQTDRHLKSWSTESAQSLAAGGNMGAVMASVPIDTPRMVLIGELADRAQSLGDNPDQSIASWWFNASEQMHHQAGEYYHDAKRYLGAIFFLFAAIIASTALLASIGALLQTIEYLGFYSMTVSRRESIWSFSSGLVVLLVSIMVALTLWLVRRNFSRQNSDRFGRWGIHYTDISIAIACLVAIGMYLVCFANPITIMAVMMLVTTTVLAILQSNYRASTNWNSGLRMAIQSGLPVPDALRLTAKLPGGGWNLKAFRLVKLIESGTGINRAIKKSRLRVDPDTAVMLNEPTVAFAPLGNSDHHSDRSGEVSEEQWVAASATISESSTPQSLTYIAILILLTTGVGYFVRFLLTEDLRELGTDMNLELVGPELARYFQFVVSGGYWLCGIIVVWAIATIVVMPQRFHFPLACVPWTGRTIIDRNRSEWLAAASRAVLRGDSVPSLAAQSALTDRRRWTRRRTRKLHRALTSGMEMSAALKKCRLIRGFESEYIRAASDNGSSRLSVALHSLSRDIGRRDRRLWRSRIAWLVPGTLILVAIYATLHGWVLYSSLARVIEGIS